MKNPLIEVTFRCPCINEDGDECGEPVEVGVFYCPAEPMTWDYPGSPESVEINEWPTTCSKGCVFDKADIAELEEQFDSNSFDWPDRGGYDD